MAAVVATLCLHHSLLETPCLVKSPFPPATILSQYCHYSTATFNIAQELSEPIFNSQINSPSGKHTSSSPPIHDNRRTSCSLIKNSASTTSYSIPTEVLFIAKSCRVIILSVFFVVICCLMSISGGLITSL